jgi:hypothetical protein
MVQTLLLDRTKVPELQRFHRLVSPITKPLLGAVRFSSLSRLKEHLGGHHFASGDEAFPSRRTILSWWMYDTTWTLAKVRRRWMWLCGDVSNCIELKIKFKTVNSFVVWFKYIHPFPYQKYEALLFSERSYMCLYYEMFHCVKSFLHKYCNKWLTGQQVFIFISFTYGKFHIVGTLI